MSKINYTQLIREEISDMLKEADKQADKIEQKLETLRKKLEKAMPSKESIADEIGDHRRMKRVQIQTVAEMIDVPLNELMLYFLNYVKTSNEPKLVEYRLGHVEFYAD